MPNDPSDKPLLDGALLSAVPNAKDDQDDDFDPDDGRAEEALEIAQELLERMNLHVNIAIRDNDREVVLDITGDDAGRAIGKKGQTLDAMQFLLNKIVNRFPEGRRHIVLDSGDFRERHDRRLEELANKEAQRALDDHKVVRLRPMSARDRRVVHMVLKDHNGLRTESEGQGLGRRIQIIPDGIDPSKSRVGGRRRR